jgi:hypothetical protein
LAILILIGYIIHPPAFHSLENFQSTKFLLIMDFLKSAIQEEISKKRKVLESIEKKGEGENKKQKYVSRAELERIREEEYKKKEKEREEKERQASGLYKSQYKTVNILY